MDIVRSERGREVMQTIRSALMRHWDPIGVADVPEAADEYDNYIGSVYRILAGSRSEDELVEFLFRTETETMGLGSASQKELHDERLHDVARRLLALNVTIDKDAV